tara:strand:+ start:585 stop:1757 length:1173 start_codon:yes stop_codon:yes gene_type:complete
MKDDFIYFDHASTTPLSLDVLEIINSANLNYWGNVSSTYKFGINCSTELESVRNNIASILNSNEEDIIFTSGSSESISLVFNKLSDKYEPENIVISEVEHQATVISSNILKKRGWKIIEWEVDNKGIVNLDKLDNYLNPKTKLISIIWGQSEIGSLQPIQLIGKKCKENNILFHVDATQIISNGIFNWQELNCDLLSLSGHKFGGPKGIGILLTNEKSRSFLRNSDISMTHEYSIRQGTQSLPLICGMHQALKNISGIITFSNYEAVFKNNKIIFLRDYLVDLIKNNKYVEITGSMSNRLPNHLSFTLLNKNLSPIKAYKIINFMSDNNISISSGSACSSSDKNPSKTLSKLGLENNKLFSNVRLSFGQENSINELDKFYNLLLECIQKF